MADLTGILGTMLATGMGGRSSRGPAFSASPFGMGGSGGLGGLGSGLGSGLGAGSMGMSAGRGGMDFKHVAGLGALGYLAYKAFQERQQNMGGQGAGSQPGAGAGTGAGSGGGLFGGLFGGGQGSGSGGSLSDRLSSVFGSGQGAAGQRETSETPEPTAYPDVAMEDQQALLLIRAMIAAANADGEITSEERQRIIGKLDEAGAGPDERQVVERELANPISTDALVREVRDQQTAEQVYLASALAIEPDTEAERSYLQYLAARLKLEPQRAEELHRIA
ncbi:MAG TPA: tellurite resistance TerB family protein [Skermanella sp.]|jgi:uncharacterized membrane protein YebE (DUF533 family)|nr:tellurite resistance TerB family protein [Skermanella sp.]